MGKGIFMRPKSGQAKTFPLGKKKQLVKSMRFQSRNQPGY